MMRLLNYIMRTREKKLEGNGVLLENSFHMALENMESTHTTTLPFSPMVNIENLRQLSFPLIPTQDLKILLNTAFQAAATN